MCCLIFKINNNLLPYLYNKLTKGSGTQDLSIRYREMYTVPKHISAQFKRGFTYNACKIFNDISNHIKSVSNLTTFCKQVKTWILSKLLLVYITILHICYYCMCLLVYLSRPIVKIATRRQSVRFILLLLIHRK